MPRFAGRWLPVLAWMVVIFFLSSLPRPVPGSLAAVPDWVAHAVVYAILAFLLCRALASGRPLVLAHALLGAALCTLYGVTDEWHQSFVPGRDASAGDVLKDLAGALLGATAYVTAASRARRSAER